MDSKKHLLLWLEAPLQSWGSDSKFGRRDTLPFPTKSGIYGLFLAAMGASGPQRELLNRLSDFPQLIISYIQYKNEVKKEGSARGKIDKYPLLMDFQMVGSGYNDKDPWQKLLIPKKRDGGAAVGGGAKMTYRYYLQDARFAVVQQLDKEMAVTVGEALQTPVFDLFLGRKNCVPTDFIYRGVFETEDDALAAANELASGKDLTQDFFVSEGEHQGDVLAINDIPIQFGDWKQYRERIVTISFV